MKNIILTISALFIIFVSIASSPLALIKFYEPMNYLDEIQNIENNGMLSGTVVNFLLDENKSIGEKTAVMNAFLTNNKANNTAETFAMHLGRKYSMSYQNLANDQLSADELFILGYLTAVDKKNVTSTAMNYLELAKAKKTNSYTINLVLALAKADQMVKENKDCAAWQICREVKNNTALFNDFDPAMNEVIFTQVDKLGEGCN